MGARVSRMRLAALDEGMIDGDVVVSDEFKAELLLVLAAEERLDARLGQHLFVVSRKPD